MKKIFAGLVGLLVAASVALTAMAEPPPDVVQPQIEDYPNTWGLDAGVYYVYAAHAKQDHGCKVLDEDGNEAPDSVTWARMKTPTFGSDNIVTMHSTSHSGLYLAKERTSLTAKPNGVGKAWYDYKVQGHIYGEATEECNDIVITVVKLGEYDAE